MKLLECELTSRETAFVGLAQQLAQYTKTHADVADRLGRVSEESFRELKKSGYLALAVPEAMGGRGASLLECVRAQMSLAGGDASVALAAAMTLYLTGMALENPLWPAERLSWLCTRVVDGALINSLASEFGVGSPLQGASTQTVAKVVPGGWRVSGRKAWVTGGEMLDLYLMSARIESDAQAQAEQAGTDKVVAGEPSEKAKKPLFISFIAERGVPGGRFEPTWSDVLSMRASGADDFVFEDMFVSSEQVLMTRERADSFDEQTRKAAGASGEIWFWAMIAATYLGVGIAALEELVEYTKIRSPRFLGKTISQLTKIREAVGRIELELWTAQSALLAVACLDPRERASQVTQFAAAKMLVTNAAVKATDLAMRAAGGAALGRNLSLERQFRDARSGIVHPPREDHVLELIACERLGPLAE